MRESRLDTNWHRAVRLVADGETRVKEQKQRIRKLKRDGHSTEQAEALLANFERSLFQMRNYVQLLELLSQKDRYSD